MKAIRVHQPGGPEVLAWEEIAQPEPGPGEALVRLDAAGVNFVDVYFRTGRYPAAMPLTLGQEGGGVVTAVGAGVSEVAAGDRVAYSSVSGAYAEYAVVPAGKLVRLPAGVSTRLGAAVMLQGMTAHYLALTTYPLQPGEWCVVHAAAGGVGLLLCQIAKLRGARVIGTVSTEEKAELARGAGAEEIIYYTREDVPSQVRKLTDGRGVPVVYDSVGLTTFEASLASLAPRGMLVSYGASSGLVPPVDVRELQNRGSLFLTRPSLAHYTLTRAELEQRAGDLFAWMAAGRLDVRIGAEYPLAQAAGAHRALEGRETTGKVLLIP